MKKILTSLPSTKPDLFFRSQASEYPCLTQRKVNYQQRLLGLINFMNKTNETRLNFLERDVSGMYQQNEDFFKEFLGVSSGRQLWQNFADREQKLGEAGQIRLLIRLLQELNDRKMNEGDFGNVEKADSYRKLVEWFIPEIVRYQQNFMDKLEKEQIKNWQANRDQRLNQFANNENKTIKDFQHSQQSRQDHLLARFKVEHQQRQKDFRINIQKVLYRVNPSKLLRQTKQKSLHKKLGTYRVNKQNPYEDEGFQKDIRQAVFAQQERKMRMIDLLKRKQKDKLSRQHKKLNDSHQMQSESQRGKMTVNLSLERDLLNNYEGRLKENMRHTLQMNKNRKVNDLKKTLEAFVKHQDETKINEIITNHQLKVRHNHNILEAVASSQSTVKDLTGRYSTIGGDHNQSAQKQLGKQKRQFQRKIRDIFRPEGEVEVNPSFYSGRKSLVDLYDKSLQLV